MLLLDAIYVVHRRTLGEDFMVNGCLHCWEVNL